MTPFGVLLACNLASLACVVGAVAILLMGGDTGWGWLLLCALMLHSTPKGDEE